MFQNVIVPRLRSWIRKVVSEEDEDLVKKTNSKPSVAEESASAAKAAAAAAADVARASQEMLITKNGGALVSFPRGWISSISFSLFFIFMFQSFPFLLFRVF